MEKVFASPSRYVQGKGVLKSGLDHILALGKRALLLADSTVYEIAGRQLEEELTVPLSTTKPSMGKLQTSKLTALAK